MNETNNAAKSERILDAAEELFALHGYDGVTLRQIANEAGVDVALASYHFGKKRDLFEATFFRRAKVMNELRLESLQDMIAVRGDDLTLQDIVSAFLTPMQDLQMNGDTGWQNYCRLVAYINSSAAWGREFMTRHFDKLISHYIEALKTVLPETDPVKLHWCYHYLSGALTLTMANTGRIDVLSKGLCKSSDFQSAYDFMIPFITAGIERVCEDSA